MDIVNVATTFNFRGYEIEGVTFLVTSIIMLLVVAPLFLYGRIYLQRRRLIKNLITAEYHAPLDLSPAELSYMFNRRLGEQEVAATIIHLIGRGLIYMRKDNGAKRLHAGPKVEKDLKPHESLLVAEISKYEDGVQADEFMRSRRSKSESPENPEHTLVETHERLAKDLLRSLGYTRETWIKQYATRTMKVTGFLLLTLVWVPLFLSAAINTLVKGFADAGALSDMVIFFIVVAGVFIVPTVVISLLAVALVGRSAGRAWVIEPKLGRHWTQIVGFRQYVLLAESEKLQYRSEQLSSSSSKDVLPYAVAFGFVKDWKKLVS